MLKSTEFATGTNLYKNGMENENNEKWCKNALKILQTVTDVWFK